MSDLHNSLYTISSLAVTFVVPTIVWVTVLAGVFQLVRDGIRRIRVMRPSSGRLVPGSRQVS